MKILRLQDYLQQGQIAALAGRADKKQPDSVVATTPPPPDPWEGLKQVQRTNELYFKIYWFALVVAFIATIVVAFFYRSEIGGLGTVLGVGGVVQGGVVLRLSAEWKEKARVDIVAALARALPPKDLAVVLKALLDGIRK